MAWRGFLCAVKGLAIDSSCATSSHGPVLPHQTEVKDEKKMNRDHLEVLQTLHNAGLISRQTMKSVRGQILGMNESQCEFYLRKLIKGAVQNKRKSERIARCAALKKNERHDSFAR